MLLNRVKKEMSLKEIANEEDVEVRLNKLHWFLQRKFIIGTIISIITFLLAIVIRAGAYSILSVQMPIFQILVIIYAVFSILCLIIIYCYKKIKEDKEKHFYRWAYFYDLYNFFMECICAFILVMTYLFSFVRVSGPSMRPTYKNGDILVCRTIGYNPKRNDVAIVFMKNVTGDKELLVKRIVGVPGDVIEYVEEMNTTTGVLEYKIKCNGEIIEDKLAYWHQTKWNNYSNSITLGKNEYFIMGDNRGNSTDSRYFGPVTRKDIVGKALFNLLFWR